MAVKSLGENDGHLDDPHALAPKLVGHLDLEAVAVGMDLVEFAGLESAAPKALVTPGRVGDGHAGNDPDIGRSTLAQHQPA